LLKYESNLVMKLLCFIIFIESNFNSIQTTLSFVTTYGLKNLVRSKERGVFAAS
jgi:hypothetical protein